MKASIETTNCNYWRNNRIFNA